MRERYICITVSLWYTAEMDRTQQINYNKNLKEKKNENLEYKKKGVKMRVIIIS